MWQSASSLSTWIKEANRKSQHVFTTGKARLSNLIVFYDDNTTWMDVGRAASIVYLDFSKAFNTVSHNNLTDEVRKCGQDGQ